MKILNRQLLRSLLMSGQAPWRGRHRDPHDLSRALCDGFAATPADGFGFRFLGHTAADADLAVIGAARGPFDAAMIPILAREP